MQGQRSLLHYKNMNVGVLQKIDQWRTWKSEVEDYTEETMPGIHKYLEKAKNEDEEVSEVDWDEEPWNQREMIWRFLKRYTTGEAKKVVTSVSHHNGWEAWRKLHLQFEPALVMREAVVMASFTNMVSRRAKTPQEAKALLLELDERAKRVEEVTGEAIENRHRMSVVMGVLDSESMKHTAAFQGAKQRADVLQRKVIEFANLVNTSSKTMDAMDIGRVSEKKSWADVSEDPWGEEPWEEPWEEAVPLSAVDTRCHKCGGVGHYATERPSKGTTGGKDGGKKGKKGGKGLGKDKGGKHGGKAPGKGAGKFGKGPGTGQSGKGFAPMDGSGRWHCGGAHFAANCTQAGQGQKGGIRPLCGLCNPTGTSHGKGNLQLDRINSGGSSEDSELQLEKINSGGSSKDRTNSEGPSEPLVPAGSVSKGPAGIGRQGLQTGLCEKGVLQTVLCQTGFCEKDLLRNRR